jgi:large subunit ribosomal protein L5
MAKDKKDKKGAPQHEEQRAPQVARHSAKETPRLKDRFRKEVAPVLMKEFELNNPMAVPHLHKIVVNMGMGEATQNAKLLDPAVNELGQITGQKPVVTRAKKSIAAFKVREGMPIGAMVTLRGDRMYEFFDRLVSVALPRVRDFRGVSPKSFDGRGNYTLGIKDQLIFPEIDYNKVEKTKGMNISITTTAKTDAEGLALLKHMGMPFRP